MQSEPSSANLAPVPRIAEHNKILMALLLGAIAGVSINLTLDGKEPRWLKYLIDYVMTPLGQAFLRMLFLTVVPLVFSSLALGVAQLGRGGNLGRIGVTTLTMFVATMLCAVTIGLSLVNWIQPGVGLPDDIRQGLLERYQTDAAAKSAASTFGVDTFVNIIPRNPLKSMVEMEMLSVIFFALLIGIAVTHLAKHRADAVIVLLEAIIDLMIQIIGWAMRLAPIGVFALIFSATTRFGYSLLTSLGWYAAVVLIGIAIQMFVVMPIILRLLARLNPWKFLLKIRAAVITAFSTSSSNATLPTSIKIAEEELNIPPSIAGFVLPLGATMNMNGTALFEGVTVMFLAQVFGVELTLGDQLVVVVLSVLTSIGAAGVPGGSLPLLAMVLATVHVPTEGIALILGIDRLLDMCRTTLNSSADIVVAACVSRFEGYPASVDPS